MPLLGQAGQGPLLGDSGVELANAAGTEGVGVERGGAGLSGLVGGGGELATLARAGPHRDGEPADEHEDHRHAEQPRA